MKKHVLFVCLFYVTKESSVRLMPGQTWSSGPDDVTQDLAFLLSALLLVALASFSECSQRPPQQWQFLILE